MDNPDTLYIGTREAIIAEVGGLSDIYEGKYLIQPDGNGAYDAHGADSKKELKALLSELKRAYPNARICYV